MGWQNMMTESSKDRFNRESTEENLRLMRRSVGFSRWTLIISIIALFVSLASFAVALIALFK